MKHASERRQIDKCRFFFFKLSGLIYNAVFQSVRTFLNAIKNTTVWCQTLSKGYWSYDKKRTARFLCFLTQFTSIIGDLSRNSPCLTLDVIQAHPLLALTGSIATPHTHTKDRYILYMLSVQTRALHFTCCTLFSTAAAVQPSPAFCIL